MIHRLFLIYKFVITLKLLNFQDFKEIKRIKLHEVIFYFDVCRKSLRGLSNSV